MKDMRRNILFSWILILATIKELAAEVCLEILTEKYHADPGKDSFKTLEETAPLPCLKECLYRRRCNAVTFDVYSRTCELYSEELVKTGSGREISTKYQINKRNIIAYFNGELCTGDLCMYNEKCWITWNGSEECVVEECVAPSQVQNMSLVTSPVSREFGTNLTYKCLNSEIFANITCLTSGQWTTLDQSVCLPQRSPICPYPFTHNQLKGKSLCYYIDQHLKSQSDSEKFCRNITGNSIVAYPVVLDSFEKTVYIAQRITESYNYIVNMYWIDGRFVNTSWQTRKGPFFFTNRTYELQTTSSDSCAYIGLDGYIKPQFCSFLLGAICEIDM